MPTDYSEKRNYFRMHLDCSMEYSLNGSDEKKTGVVKNLSGEGVSLLIDQKVNPGTEIQMSITPENPITPPLDITVEVLRCDKIDAEGYEIAGSIIKR
ncbi:MAG: PilZ domain-containing protein [Gammaproteobacteria bacterium]